MKPRCCARRTPTSKRRSGTRGGHRLLKNGNAGSPTRTRGGARERGNAKQRSAEAQGRGSDHPGNSGRREKANKRADSDSFIARNVAKKHSPVKARLLRPAGSQCRGVR